MSFYQPGEKLPSNFLLDASQLTGLFSAQLDARSSKKNSSSEREAVWQIAERMFIDMQSPR
jgi:hypothetical protein